jgi:chaperone protein EcpD
MQENKLIPIFVASVLGFSSLPSVASVVVSGTRVVYSLTEKEQTVRLSNDGKLPSLVQVWVDDGDIKANPNTAKAPFLVSPPVSRIDVGKGQSIRLIYTGEPVPQDVESIYYFNLLEIPPKPAAEEGGQLLQFAFRTRIKLFLRPDGLEGDANEAPTKITWRAERHGDVWEVIASNPTPYHVTFLNLDVKTGDATLATSAGGMLKPRETSTFSMKSKNDSFMTWEKIEYRFVNDHGGVVSSSVSNNK